jgi:CheY-like chemotaxis protein
MLLQSQKMEAIGTLAGGIAHDFNNILGGIVGYIQLAALEIPHDQKAYKYIEQVLKASYRARDLVQQILTFSRQTEVEKKPLLVGLIIKEVVKLLKASLPASIEVDLIINNPQVMIYANPTHIHQILMNLCTNAKHAMGNNIGKLAIRVETVDKIDKGSFPGFNLDGDKHVLIRISDTGQGIPPTILDRIFEPYFTTREKGEGTGLGLAVVHRIVTDHKGGIAIESRLGEGTTFTVALPIHEGLVEETTDKVNELPRGNERIILVDDEIFLLEIGKDILEKLGYHVITTASPEEAIQIVRKAPGNFDLLITDMTMPKLTGEMLAVKIHEFKPELPVILCTGFSETMNIERAEKAGINALLLKPVLIEKYSTTVRNVLDKKNG